MLGFRSAPRQEVSPTPMNIERTSAKRTAMVLDSEIDNGTLSDRKLRCSHNHVKRQAQYHANKALEISRRI